MTAWVRAGVASADITPPAGAALSGFVARTRPATGAHDPLTVRALVVGNTAVVTVDVVGLHEETCHRIRERAPLPADHVVVHATHTHGGPVSMPDRLGEDLDGGWLARVEDTAADTIGTALAGAAPARLAAGYGADPGVAVNRRRPDGPVDRKLPCVLLTRPDGTTLATLVSYACHPVVLGPDNLQFTADYPGAVRRRLEAALGGTALFVTGCAGDANTGHDPAASITAGGSPRRTFAACERVGERVATAALARLGPFADEAGSADATGVTGALPDHRAVVAARRAPVNLPFSVPTLATVAADAARWRELAGAAPDPAQRALYDCWARWAVGQAAAHRVGDPVDRWRGEVTILDWGPVTVVGLPGEPFAATAAAVRECLRAGQDAVVVAGYCDGCPGYLPPAEEYAFGGYEVEHAHRYYGMPGPFAPGAAERLLAAFGR